MTRQSVQILMKGRRALVGYTGKLQALAGLGKMVLRLGQEKF
jgi:hypothetical protein